MPTKRKSNKLKAKAEDATSLVRALDMFMNSAARTGWGTSSLPETTEYPLVRLTYNYYLMLTLYRNHWIARKVVDVPAQDMVRAWPKLNTEITPEDEKRVETAIRETGTKQRVLQCLKWSRLFGGAGALIVIDGHEKAMEEPLDLEQVMPGSYRGLIPFDRWSGISPDVEIGADLDHPKNFGLPEFYRCTPEYGKEAFRVHHTRILRFCGPEVPTPEFQAQDRWGLSVIEIIYEEMKKRDNMSFAILNLLFRANIIAQVNPDLAQILSGAGMSQAAATAFSQRMLAQNQLLSNQNMIVLPKDGELQTHQYSFGGVSDVYQQFQLDIAGASAIPVARLFGRTITGLGQTNDADERIYEERVANDQENDLRPELERLYRVICMSELGEEPEDFDLKFPSVRVLTEEEKAALAKDWSAATIEAFNAGLISPKIALKELKEQSKITGVFTNITDEEIDKAEDEPQQMGEMGLGGKNLPGYGQPNPSRQLGGNSNN